MVEPSQVPWWSKVARWRNWPVTVKLAAVLVVPILAVVALEVNQVVGDVRRVDSFTSAQQFVALGEAVNPAVTELQRERSLAIQPTAKTDDNYRRQIEATDKATSSVLDLAKRIPKLSAAALAKLHDLELSVGQLSSRREVVLGGQGADEGTVDAYNTVIDAAMGVDDALEVQLGELVLAGPAAALFDLEGAREQLRREQDVVLLGIGRGYLTGAEQQQLIKGDVGYDNEIAIFNTIAPDRWRQQFQQTVPGVDANVRDQLLKQAIAAPADPPPNTPAANRKPGAAMNIRGDEWNQKSDATVQLVMKVEDGLRGELRDTAAALRENASNQVGTESVILAVILLLAGAIGLIVSRYLLRSLSLLRNTALDVAKRGLPEAVARIREGRGDEVVIDPVPVHTTEEFGQLARAFDEVHGQAVRSASEQAALRSNLSNIFVNLSRRSQGLVERQLRLMEQLERHEENPEQLANLFKLDHLATRMRRNNENLMVLSGLDLARRFSRPLPLGDVLRAAVSEIEHYQRAMVRSAPPVSVVGYAAGDLVRLIAELLDNATAFSRSDTQVVVDSGHRADGSVVIEVTDEGIGLGDAELAEINQRVSAIVSAEVPVSRQMGLFVVGQLASRHSFRVHFSRRTDAAEGLVASVGVPAELIVDVTSTVLPAVPGQNGVLAASVPAPASAPEELAPGEPDARTQPAGESVFHAPASGVVQWPDTEDADDVEVYDDVWSLPDEDEPVTVDPAPEPQTSQPTWFAATVEPEPEPEPLMTPAADPPAGTARHTWFDSEPDAAGGHPGTDNRTAGRHSAVPNRAGAAEPFTAPMPVQELTPQWPSDPGDELVDLPKRVPRASLFPALDERRTADPGTVATSTNADRNRGFLASYQSGIRADNTRTDRDRQASPIQNERGQNS